MSAKRYLRKRDACPVDMGYKEMAVAEVTPGATTCRNQQSRSTTLPHGLAISVADPELRRFKARAPLKSSTGRLVVKRLAGKLPTLRLPRPCAKLPSLFEIVRTGVTKVFPEALLVICLASGQGHVHV